MMSEKNVPNASSNLEFHEFRKIPSLDFLYEINGNGTILRNVKSKKQLKIKLDFHHSKNGYYMVWICFKKKVYRKSIHSLVAECWLGEKPEGYEIDHIDRNSRNNDYRNLRYIAKSQQMKNRDHTKIAARETENCMRWVESIKKPVKITGEKIQKVFDSMTSCAKWLGIYYNKKTEHMRVRLKKRRSHIYDFDITYL